MGRFIHGRFIHRRLLTESGACAKTPGGMLDPDDLKRLLLAAFPDASITLVDLTGTRDHYEASIVSMAFEGHSRVAQHQMVYRALGTAMHGPIHALALKTKVPIKAGLPG